MTSKKSWARDTGWLFGANLSKTAGLLVILIVLARFTTAETVGRYALAMAITAPIFVFAQLGLKGIYLTHKSAFRFSRYLEVQLFAVLSASLLSVAIALITDVTLAITVGIVSLIKCVDAISDLYSGPLQRHSKTNLIFSGFFFTSISSAVISIAVLIATHSLELTLVALFLVSLLASLILLWRPGNRILAAFEKTDNAGLSKSARPIRDILRAGLPIGLGGALVALLASMPQYFLSVNFGADAVAHFAIYFYVFAVADIFLGTVAQGWIPRARQARTDDNIAPRGFFHFLAKTAFLWTLLVTPLAIIGLILSHYLIPVIFGPTFQLSLAIAIPIGVAILALPYASFSNIGVIIQNMYSHTITLSVIAVLASFVACALLIPEYEISGAFWALAISAVARSISTMFLLKREEIKAR